MTFEAIEAADVEAFLAQLRDELLSGSYHPLPARKHAIPKRNGGERMLQIPSIRDRVVQGAVKLILEPIFEADFQPGSYGYRPRRTAHQAAAWVAEAIVLRKTRVIDLDLAAYFDNVRHHRLLEMVAKRVSDPAILRLLKLILQVTGRQGLPQGGPLSPLLSNIYLTPVDCMLEKARETTRHGPFWCVTYARWADDLVLVHADPREDWLVKAVHRRLREELAKLSIPVNEAKSRVVDLAHGEMFTFLGFDFRRYAAFMAPGGRSIHRRATSARSCCGSSGKSFDVTVLTLCRSSSRKSIRFSGDGSIISGSEMPVGTTGTFVTGLRGKCDATWRGSKAVRIRLEEVE